jgi:hypothetical protein
MRAHPFTVLLHLLLGPAVAGLDRDTLANNVADD